MTAQIISFAEHRRQRRRIDPVKAAALLVVAAFWIWIGFVISAWL